MDNSLYQKWCKVSDKIRFLFVGGLNAGVSYVIFAIAILLLGQEHYQLCAALQWGISSVFSYVTQKFLVFCTRGNYIKEYLKCCSTWFISYLLNVVILELFVKFVFKNVFIAQLFSIFTVSVFTYIMFKKFAFKSKN